MGPPNFLRTQEPIIVRPLQFQNRDYIPALNSTNQITVEDSIFDYETSKVKSEHDLNPTFLVETEVGEVGIDTSAIKKELLELNSKYQEDSKIEKPHKCSVCSTKFQTSAHLKRHVETVHEGLRPHKCTTCNKGFAELCNLKTHVATVHEGKRPFQCSICGNRFAKKFDLKMHIKTVHEGEKPYPCQGIIH